MCAQRFLGFVFVLILLFVAGAFSIYQWGGDILIKQAVPKGHFQAAAPGDEPDYSSDGAWLARAHHNFATSLSNLGSTAADLHESLRLFDRALAWRTVEREIARGVTTIGPHRDEMRGRIAQALGAERINIEDFELHHMSPERGGVLTVLVTGEEPARRAASRGRWWSSSRCSATSR